MANNTIQDLINSTANDPILSGLSFSDANVGDALSQLFGSEIEFRSIASQAQDVEEGVKLSGFHPYKIVLGVKKLPAPFDFIDGSASEMSIAFGVFDLDGGAKSGKVFGISGDIKIHNFDFKFDYSGNYFSAQIAEANPPTLNSLLNSLLPSKIDIPIADKVAVSEVDFFIDFNANPNSFGFTINTKGKINLFNDSAGSLAIENPSVGIIFIGNKPSSVKFNSIWDIDDSYYFKINLEHDLGMGTDFSLHYSENYSQAQLPDSKVPTAKLKLSKLSNSIPYLDSGILGDVLKEFNNIDITEIMLNGNLGAKVIGAKVYGSWTPQDDTIKKVLSGTEDVYGEFSHDSIKKTTSYTLGATIKEESANIGASLSQAGDSSDNQYSIFGKDLNLKVGDLITKAEGHLNTMYPGDKIEIQLPAEIQSALDSITVDSFDCSKQGDNITCSLKIKENLALGKLMTGLGIGDLGLGTFNPGINELEIDYSKTKVSDTVTDKTYSLSAWLSKSNTEVKPDFLLKISKITTSTGTDIFTGNIFNLGGGTINISGLGGLDINDFFFAHFKKTDKTTINILGSDLDLNANVDLSKMEVVGHYFKEAGVKLDAFRVVYGTDSIAAPDLAALNEVLQGSNISPLTNPKSSATNNNGTALGLDKGLTVQGNIIINQTHVIPLHSTAGSTPPPPAAANGTPTSNNISSNSNPTPVGKKFGPVTFTAVSIGLKDSKIHLVISGNIHIGPIEVDFINFTIDTPVPTRTSPWPDPTFDIGSLALKIDKPPLSLAGEFLKEDRYYHADSSIDTSGAQIDKDKTAPATKQQKDDKGAVILVSPYPVKFTQYSGGLSIGIKKIQIVALGSYAKIGDPLDVTSLFIYGALSVPIALPPIGVLESVALGFGMNRNVVMPTPDQIDSHPLVAPLLDAQPKDAQSRDALPKFAAMSKSIPIEKGEDWFALGVRLSVLQMADALLLLIVKFGNKLEIDILGRAAFTLPKTAKGAPALCNLIVGVDAIIQPDEGVVSVLGGFLKGSYIYCPEVQISGGFGLLHISAGDRTGTQYADATEGEFVLTLGGYSPHYTPKPYYPVVPRLALTWKVSDHLNVLAQAYCAIVPEAFMIGGKLTADFKEGGDFSISVHFEVGVDFIVWFKPYHYKGDAFMNLAVTASINLDLLLFSIHQTVEIDAHAEVVFWGPDFAGHADVSVHFVVTFSASVNFGKALTPPPPLSLSDFISSFFKVEPSPQQGNSKNLSLQITDGLLSQQPYTIDKVRPLYDVSKGPITLVNPKELEFELTSAIPIQKITVTGGPETPITGTDSGLLGIAPMANTNSDFSKSEFTVTISKDGQSLTDFTNLIIEPVRHNFPAGIWKAVDTGGSLQSPDHSNPLLNLCSGLKISAKPPVSDAAGLPIPGVEYDVISMPSFTLNTTPFTYQ